MRKTLKPPSEWLKLLCYDWAMDNEVLVETADAKFIDYKPFLKGMLTSQLLCRLSIPPTNKLFEDGTTSNSIDFWFILGIVDEFDRAYVISQIERFCALYSIRAISLEMGNEQHLDGIDAASVAAAAAAGLSVSLGTEPYVDPTATAAAAAAVGSRPRGVKREQRRLLPDKKFDEFKTKEERAAQKANERVEREAHREDQKRRRLSIRMQRERFAKEQKEAAFKRAADLVSSNRVPIEITRGGAAAKAAQAAIQAQAPRLPVRQAQAPVDVNVPQPRKRSAIVVSTAADLHEIVTLANNLYTKYSAIAKEHNQKVSWITVSRELGIHVKVREKYARMHARACQRGFAWERFGHWKIRTHPEIFTEPTEQERNARMPPPLPDITRTVPVGNTTMPGEDSVAAAAAVVDASVSTTAVESLVVPSPNEQTTTAAATVAPTLVADPTAGTYEHYV